jgi:hypothetical protein
VGVVVVLGNAFKHTGLDLEVEKATLDATDDDGARLEVRIVTPGARESHSVALRSDVETAYPRGNSILQLGGVQKNQTVAVVTQIAKAVLVDVQVVVNHSGVGVVRSSVSGVAEVRDIPDQSAGVGALAVKLVKFVVHQKHALVSSQPALVGVLVILVVRDTDQHRCVLDSHITDHKLVFVVVEADLLASVAGVGTRVHDTLGIVRITLTNVTTTSESWVLGITNVDHVEAARASTSTNRISIASILVHYDVVGVSELTVPYIRRDGAAFSFHAKLTQLGHVHDLHAVVTGLRNNIGVVLIDLHITPDGGNSGGREPGDNLGAVCIRHINE